MAAERKKNLVAGLKAATELQHTLPVYLCEMIFPNGQTSYTSSGPTVSYKGNMYYDGGG